MDTQVHTKMQLDKSVFRAYDIRGIVGEGLTEDVVYQVGRAFASECQRLGETSVIVGYDGRPSSDGFQKALCRGLMESGVDVINIGLVPTPVLYYATQTLQTRSGIMITGSHNPSNYNGIKMVLAGKTLTAGAIQVLYQRIVNQDLTVGQGQQQRDCVLARYLDCICGRVQLARPMKIVVDCGNGMASVTACQLFERLGCEVIPLYAEVDGRFPNHHPDPTILENMQDLMQRVIAEKADVGLAFDGDADRLGVVTNTGELIWPDRVMMLLAEDTLARCPGAKIVFDVKCTSHLAHVIEQKGGQPIMWKTGHSILKAKMFEEEAPLAGELSGHIFYREGWFGFDDGVYVGARLLEILSKKSQSSAEIFAAYPDSINTPELKVMVPEDEKFALVDRLIARVSFPGAQANTVDGLRVDFADGWALVRASNTTPCLTVRFEAKDQATLDRIAGQMRQELLAVDATLTLPF